MAEPIEDVGAGRKRGNKDKWKREQAKKKRNSGEEYVSDKTKKVVPAKKQGAGCKCAQQSRKANLNWCKYHTLGQEEKHLMFRDFYKLGSYDTQNALLFELIKSNCCGRHYSSGTQAKRVATFTYSVRNKEGCNLRVCAKAFCDLFAISRKRLATARGSRNVEENQSSNGNVDADNNRSTNDLCKELVSSRSPHVDRRGKHSKCRPKLNVLVRLDVRRHIIKVLRYIGECLRKTDLHDPCIRTVKSIAEMHRLYEQECIKSDTQPATYDTYIDVFRKEFDIGFQSPGIDNPEICDEWYAQVSDDVSLDVRLYLMSEKLEINKSFPGHNCDSHLPAPKMLVETLLYLRELWAYNLGMHVSQQKKNTVDETTEDTNNSQSEENLFTESLEQSR